MLTDLFITASLHPAQAPGRQAPLPLLTAVLKPEQYEEQKHFLTGQVRSTPGRCFHQHLKSTDHYQLCKQGSAAFNPDHNPMAQYFTVPSYTRETEAEK